MDARMKRTTALLTRALSAALALMSAWPQPRLYRLYSGAYCPAFCASCQGRGEHAMVALL